ncbi:MAG: hypothetical protein V4719_26160 [Planctomycetota bacterium]
MWQSRIWVERTVEACLFCLIIYIGGPFAGWWRFPWQENPMRRLEMQRLTRDAFHALAEIDSEYHSANDTYPENVSDLVVWGMRTDSPEAAKWRELTRRELPLESLAIDPWGHAIVLSTDKGFREFVSSGPDGVMGTKDDMRGK